MHPREAAIWLVQWADAMVKAIEELRQVTVDRARRDGMSWADIGAALGISRQAAWERYGR